MDESPMSRSRTRPEETLKVPNSSPSRELSTKQRSRLESAGSSRQNGSCRTFATEETVQWWHPPFLPPPHVEERVNRLQSSWRRAARQLKSRKLRGCYPALPPQSPPPRSKHDARMVREAIRSSRLATKQLRTAKNAAPLPEPAARGCRLVSEAAPRTDCRQRQSVSEALNCQIKQIVASTVRGK